MKPILGTKFVFCGAAYLWLSLLLVGCGTTGGGTRTSGMVYQPTDAASIQIIWERPTRPYEIIGQVSSTGGGLASDDAVYRAMQKEAAELGAHAILIQGGGVDYHAESMGSFYKHSTALAIRYTDGYGSNGQYALTPTNVNPTTPQAEQIIPRNATGPQVTPQAVPQPLPVAEKAQGTDPNKIYFYSPYDPQRRLLSVPKEDAGKQTICPYTGKLFIAPNSN
jgi:hypothetical protein